MLKLSNLNLPVGHTPDDLRRKIVSTTGLKSTELGEYTILRQSIDARKKSEVRWVYTVGLDLPNEKLRSKK